MQRRHCVILLTAAFFQGSTAMTIAPNDVASVTQASGWDFPSTLDRLTNAIGKAGLTVFSRIDHAAAARDAGLTMPPTIVLVYGNPKGGTPLMLAAPEAALDLPLRVLVREDAGVVKVTFRPIVPLLVAAGVPESLARTLEPAQALLLRAIQP